MWTRYYARQAARTHKKVIKLGMQVEQIAKNSKHISGSAFVTFADPSHRDHFLKEKPQCWKCRNYTFFTFGRPPFASMTLNCMRAPHPSDVNWLNLHVPTWRQNAVGLTCVTLLIITMVTIITPVTLTSQ